MLGYIKAAPTTYLLHYSGGHLRREGPGLAFIYWKPGATLISVPLASADLPFAFAEVTADFQQVTIQGRLTYRIARPRELATLLDHSITPRGAYRSDDPEKLPERLVQATQRLARGVLERLSLRQALGSVEELTAQVRAGLDQAQSVGRLGVEVLDLASPRSAPPRKWPGPWRRRRGRHCSGSRTRRSTTGATQRWNRNGGSRRMSSTPKWPCRRSSG